MKYKTAFRLALKAIGVFMLATTLPQLPSTAVWVGDLLLSGPPGMGGVYALTTSAQGALGVVIALYLFFGGRWIVNLAIPSNRPYCLECGYELTGNVSGVCPECGTANRAVQGSVQSGG